MALSTRRGAGQRKTQNGFEDDDDDDEVQYDNSPFQSGTNEIKEMIKAMEFSVNKMFTDIHNQICDLTDCIGMIEEWQDKMTSELSSSMSTESSSTEGSNDSAGRKRRTPPELQVYIICLFTLTGLDFHLH